MDGAEKPTLKSMKRPRWWDPGGEFDWCVVVARMGAWWESRVTCYQMAAENGVECGNAAENGSHLVSPNCVRVNFRFIKIILEFIR